MPVYLRLRKHLPKGGFLSNVFTLMTGTVLSQVIMVITTPIITRLYNPDDFGMLALYTSVTGIFTVIVSWRYDQAIMLPKEDKQAINILALSISITFAMAFIILLVMAFARNFIANLLYTEKLGFWLWFSPLGVLFGGLYQSLNYWSTRKKSFRFNALSRVSQSIVTVGTTISIALIFQPTAGGLIAGSIFGTSIGIIILFIQIWKDGQLKLFSNVNKFDMWSNAVEYKKFPYFDSWSGLLNSFSQQVPVFLFSRFFSQEVVGFYSLANRILNLPAGVVGQSVRQVYFQSSAELYASSMPIKRSFLRSTFGLIAVGVLPFSIIMIFGKPLFSLVFGANWAISGLYAQIISPWLFVGFITPPATSLWIVFRKQDKLLIWNSCQLIIRLLSIYMGYYLFKSEVVSLVFFSATGFLFYILLIGYGYYCLNIYSKKNEIL
jgi:lipopolysaccharide exporter